GLEPRGGRGALAQEQKPQDQDGRRGSRETDPRQALTPLSTRDARERESRFRAFRDSLELFSDITRGLPAVLRIFGETAFNDAVERRRRHELNLRDRQRLIPQDRRDQTRLARPRERLLSRRHLVENRAEGEDVRSRIGFLSSQP